MSTDNPEGSSEPLNTPDGKALLECEKLKAEIESIRRPFYRTPSFYTAIAPVTLAILGLLFTWFSGWFDVQRTRINNEKILLEAQTTKLQQERSKLETETRLQQEHLNGLENEVRILRLDRTALTNQMSQLQRERDEFRSAKDFFESEAKRLAGSETNAMRVFNELQSAQADRRAAMLEIEKRKSESESLRNAVDKQTVLLRRAYDVLLESIRIGLSEKRVSDARFLKHNGDVIDLTSELTKFMSQWQPDSPPTNPPSTDHK